MTEPVSDLKAANAPKQGGPPPSGPSAGADGSGPAGIPGVDSFLGAELERCIASSQEPLPGLQQRWPVEVELGVAAQSSIYHGYPYLFLGAFPALVPTPERVEPLALACRLFADSLFVADDIMDEDPTDRERSANVLRIQAMQFEGYRLLHGLFPPEAKFWQRVQTYMAVYAKACLDEKLFSAPHTGWADLTEAAALSIARGKSSLAKFAIAGLAEMAGDEEPFEPLTRSLGRYYVARQMVDDLTDWRDDLKRGVPSLLLARLAAVEFPGEGKEELQRDVERTSRAIYFGGHGRYVLEKALQVLTSARKLSEPYPELPFVDLLVKLRAHCEELLQGLDRLTGAAETPRQSFQLRVPQPDGPWQELAWQGLARVLERWRPRRQAPSPEEDGERPRAEARWHRSAPGGDLIVRTAVAEALEEADGALGGQLEELLQGEIKYLLARGSKTGGWGLSTVFPGLPGDADHLARAMTVLLRTGHREELQERCEAPLAALLEQAAERRDGALPTWVLPGGDAADEGAEPPPGGEPDPSVVARLLHALWLYDPDAHRRTLEAGVRWLEGSQGADGSWASPAYRGPYEPTAEALGALAALEPSSPALARGGEFLRRSQRPDGSWGLGDEPGDPTSTALALLGLAHLQRVAGEPGGAEVAGRGREWLGRVLEGGPEVGGGLILSAAFALRAGLLWHRLEQRRARRRREQETAPVETGVTA